MKIINRYILLESTLYFLISLSAFTGILLVLRMLKLSSLIINKGVAISQVVLVFISIIPTFLEIAIPLSALLGVMLAFARLSGDSEIVVIRASGISLKQLILPVTIFGLGVSIFGLYISLDLKPWGYTKLENTLFDIAKSKSTAGLNSGMFNKLGNITLYAEEISHQTGALKNILIDDRRGEASKVIIAKTGRIESNREQRQIVFHLKSGEIHEIVDGKYVITDYQKNDISLDPDELYDNKDSDKKRSRQLSGEAIRKELGLRERLAPDDFLNEEETQKSSFARASKLSTSIAPTETFKENLKRMNRLKIELSKRWSLPLSALILALIAMPLGVQPPRTQRTWGAGLSSLIGMIVFVIYFALLSVSIALAENGTLIPAIAVWIPNIATLLVAIYMLKKMSSEDWQSVAQAVEGVANFIIKRFRRIEDL